MSALRRQYGRGTNAPQARARASLPAHKFKVGQEVRFLRSAPQKLSKEIEQSLFTSSFEVNRLLPAVGTVFQYRVRNLATGQERVADEAEIIAITADNAG